MQPLIGVDQALELLLSQVEPGEPQDFALDGALGLVLAESVAALEQHPADDTSAMDGYAVRSADLVGVSSANPITLRLLEDIRTGTPPVHTVGPGQTSRISTGGLIPSGVDAVVMREEVSVSESGVVFTEPVCPGQNIRYAGEHIGVGEEILRPGCRLGPAELGMAAFLGRDQLRCIPRVTAAVLSTGSELVEATAQLERGQIRDSNGISLASALRSEGCEVISQVRVADQPRALEEALKEAFASSKVVLTSGGISAGWHDLVRGQIEKVGGEFSFHKLRMRPGKPLAFGRCGQSLFFCLPGNPVSSMVTFEVFVKPALRKLSGREPYPRTFKARLAERIEKRPGLTIFYRGILANNDPAAATVRLTGPQGSHLLRSLVEADVLIRAEEDDEVLEAGAEVTVLPFKA